MSLSIKLVCVKIIIWIVVLLKKLDKANEFGQTVHTALCAVDADSGNSFRHFTSLLVPNKLCNTFLASCVKTVCA